MTSELAKDDLIERINAACVGHPHAKIPWPHRLLHECRDRIEALEGECAELRGRHEEARDKLANMTDRCAEAWDAASKEAERAESAEAERDKLLGLWKPIEEAAKKELLLGTMPALLESKEGTGAYRLAHLVTQWHKAAKERDRLRELLKEARVQLDYSDASPEAIARIDAALEANNG